MDPKAKPVRLVDAQGEELAALLSPVSPQTFVNEHWGRKPLFVKGFAEKFKGFFDTATFFRALASPGGAPSGHLRASFDKKAPPPRSDAAGPVDGSQNFPIQPELAAPLYDAGATICLTEIDARVPRLKYFAAAIKRQLGHPGLVAFNAYLSGPGAGLNWHFDGRIASTLQIEGSKKWRFSKRVAVEWPRGNAIVLSDGSARYDTAGPRAAWEEIVGPEKGQVTEVLLEPGDFLCLPAGTWHDASGGATGSLALNLAFNPIPYSFVVSELLDTLLASDPSWRCVRPLLPRLGGEPGETDPRALEAIAKQLEAAGDALRSTAADGSALVALWSSLVQSGAPPVEIGATSPGPVAPTDRLRVRADGNVYARTAENGSRLVVSVGAARVELTGDAMRVAQRALATKKFDAGASVEWGAEGKTLAWSDAEKILAQLLAEGVLERTK